MLKPVPVNPLTDCMFIYRCGIQLLFDMVKLVTTAAVSPSDVNLGR